MNYYAHLQNKVKQVAELFGIETSASHLTEGIFVLVFALAGAGAYYGYHMYVENREQHAYEAFMEVMHAYAQAQEESFKSVLPNNTSENVENVWKDVEIIIDAGYKENSNSYLAPFFLSYKANVMLEQGKTVDEAYECMKEALTKISSSSEFYNILKLKAAKMACDCSQEAVREQGLKQLQEIAQDQSNIGYQEAGYTLGVYHLVHNQIEQARAEFQKIVDQDTQDLFAQSLWVKEAKEKLAAL